MVENEVVLFFLFFSLVLISLFLDYLSLKDNQVQSKKFHSTLQLTLSEHGTWKI